MRSSRAWRCSNCGEEAELKDGYAPMDPRYGLGTCGHCSLRGEVPLVMATASEAQDVVVARAERQLIAKQLTALTVGHLPSHSWREGCCDVAKSEHVTQARLGMLMGRLTVAPTHAKLRG